MNDWLENIFHSNRFFYFPIIKKNDVLPDFPGCSPNWEIHVLWRLTAIKKITATISFSCSICISDPEEKKKKKKYNAL
jgi:hypothetical protein